MKVDKPTTIIPQGLASYDVQSYASGFFYKNVRMISRSQNVDLC